MKAKRNIWINQLILIVILLMITNGCKKDNNNPSESNIIFNPNLTYGSVSDIDGNTYKTIVIGTQTWMAENLKTTKYRDGSTIPNVSDVTAWGNLSGGAYCNYDNDVNNSTTYGRLYNWLAVNDSRIIAPNGWHIPTDADWTTLTNFLGGENVAGGKLKETGTVHWNNANTGATNETGFTALPSGRRYSNGNFYNIGDIGHWWSATESNTNYSWARYLHSNDITVTRYDDGKANIGFSVRCVKD